VDWWEEGSTGDGSELLLHSLGTVEGVLLGLDGTGEHEELKGTGLTNEVNRGTSLGIVGVVIDEYPGVCGVDPGEGLGGNLGDSGDKWELSVESGLSVWVVWSVSGEKLVWVVKSGSLKDKGILSLTESEEGLSWYPDTKTKSSGDGGLVNLLKIHTNWEHAHDAGPESWLLDNVGVSQDLVTGFVVKSIIVVCDHGDGSISGHLNDLESIVHNSVGESFVHAHAVKVANLKAVIELFDRDVLGKFDIVLDWETLARDSELGSILGDVSSKDTFGVEVQLKGEFLGNIVSLSGLDEASHDSGVLEINLDAVLVDRVFGCVDSTKSFLVHHSVSVVGASRELLA